MRTLSLVSVVLGLAAGCRPTECPTGFTLSANGMCLQDSPEDTGDTGGSDTADTVDTDTADTDSGDTDTDTGGDTGTGGDDADHDGYTVAEGDCQDDDATVNPAAAEVCDNGKDDDCDGSPGECGWSGSADLPDSDVMLLGHRAYDGVGLQLAVGDHDGDGQADVLAGAPYVDDGGDGSGAIYVVDGPITGEVSLHDDATQTILGDAANDVAGIQAGFVGDLDGDGAEEILAVARHPQTGTGFSPSVYILRGGGTGELRLADSDDLWEAEAHDDSVGLDGAGVGDVTGDGLADVLLGARTSSVYVDYAGAAYVVSGAPEGGGQLEDADVRLLGDQRSLGFGACVTAAGDVNADGTPDFAVGAGGYSHGGSLTGAVYVFFGPVSGTLTAAQADALVVGPVGGDTIADDIDQIAGAGDSDGDGHDDLALLVMGADHGADVDAGAFAVLGGDGLSGEVSAVTADGIVYGDSASDYVGYGFSAFDADGDDHADVLVGAPGDDRHGRFAGAAWLVYGPIHGSMDAADAQASFYGDAESAEVGWTAASGDVTGDGVLDLLIGAPGAEGDTASAGAIFVEPGGGF